jgi:hypothetical protein
MNATVTHLLASKDSKETMSSVVAFIGGMMGTKLQHSLSSSDFISVLKGESEAPNWLLQGAKMIDSLKDNREASLTLVDMGLQWLETHNFERAKVLKMIRQYSPIIGVVPDDESEESLVDAIQKIATRIVDADVAPPAHAVVDCPYCRQVFLV